MLNDKEKMLVQMRTFLAHEVQVRGQKSVADITGTSQAAISRALSCTHINKVDTLVRWLKCLGYEVEFVVRRSILPECKGA